MNARVPYPFDATAIRVQVIDGEPWFIASPYKLVEQVMVTPKALAKLAEAKAGA